MKVSYDPIKRDQTLATRGLDFEDAFEIVEQAVIIFEDVRFEYPERRWVTFGILKTRLVALVWSPLDDGIRVISLRKANEREQRKYDQRVER